MKRALAALAIAVAGTCGGNTPATRYYQLESPSAPAVHPTGKQLIVLEPLTTESGYDDDRIVYRTSPVRLDYYEYHRWSAEPGVMIGNYLEQALVRSGRFRGVVRDLDPTASVVLGGRVIAIEEIDESHTKWRGHLVLELRLTDAHTNAVVWTQQFEEREPLVTQSPEGLAHALSVAMARIAARVVPIVAEVADRQAAASHR